MVWLLCGCHLWAFHIPPWNIKMEQFSELKVTGDSIAYMMCFKGACSTAWYFSHLTKTHLFNPADQWPTRGEFKGCWGLHSLTRKISLGGRTVGYKRMGFRSKGYLYKLHKAMEEKDPAYRRRWDIHGKCEPEFSSICLWWPSMLSVTLWRSMFSCVASRFYSQRFSLV